MKTFRISPDAYPTLPAALAAAENTVGDVTFVLSGECRLASPVVLDKSPLFDGTHTVSFEGENDASLDGGIRVTGFVKVSDTLWRADLPKDTFSRHLYIDGRSAPRPHTAPVTAFGWDETKGETDFFTENGEVTGLVTTDRDVLKWKNIRDVELVFNVGWTHHIIPITGVHEMSDGRVYIRPLEAPFGASRQMAGVKIGGCPTYFDNVFECLSDPLSWYLDSEESALYLCLEKDDTPEKHDVVLALCEELIRVAGTPAAKAGKISFHNITFKNTTFNRPHTYGHSDLQAGYARTSSVGDMPKREKPYDLDSTKLPAAVRFIACRGVTFDHCTFTCLASTALAFEFGSEDCRVLDCDFHDLGAGAMTVGDVVGDRAHHPDDPREIVRAVTLENCTVCRTGTDFFSTAAVLLGYVTDCAVLHNDIYDVPYSGVSVGWGWGGSDISVGDYRKTPWHTPSSSLHNNISFNHIHHCMMTLYDGGAIYTLGAMDGTVIRGNHIHNAGGYDGDGCHELAIGGVLLDGVKTVDLGAFQKLGPFPGGIYLDEGSRGIEVYDNVIYGATVPLFYHNQINGGYTMVDFHDNLLHARPETDEAAARIAAEAGRKRV